MGNKVWLIVPEMPTLLYEGKKAVVKVPRRPNEQYTRRSEIGDDEDEYAPITWSPWYDPAIGIIHTDWNTPRLWAGYEYQPKPAYFRPGWYWWEDQFERPITVCPDQVNTPEGISLWEQAKTTIWKYDSKAHPQNYLRNQGLLPVKMTVTGFDETIDDAQWWHVNVDVHRVEY